MSGGSGGGGAFKDFNIDKQEYQSVFKVFDKNNQGEINIAQVYELINKFEQATSIQQSNKTDQQPLGPGGKPIGSSKYPGNNIGNGSTEVSSNIIGAGGIRTQGTIGGTNFSSKMAGNKATANNLTTMKTNISPTTKKAAGPSAPAQGQVQGGQTATGGSGFGPGGLGLQLKPTAIDPLNSKSPRMIAGATDKGINVSKQQTLQQQPSLIQQQTTLLSSSQKDPSYLSEEVNFGNVPLVKDTEDKKSGELTFPNGKTTLKFEDFFSIVEESCADKEQAENYLIHAFSMFDRKKKGYINNEDLKEVFKLLGETVTDDEVNTMIKIAGVKSSDKINFKEFVDFFNKVD